jgi:osmotically inducible lipoprotein OsmB
MPQQITRITLGALVVASLALGGCGSLNDAQRDTAIGATVGGVAGSVLTGGSTAGTVGGAVIGGVIANEKDKK